MKPITSRAGIALAAAAALTLSACGEAPDEENGDGENGEAAEDVDYTACLVSDEGGWDDQSFNQSAYEGLQDAIEDFGVDDQTAESQSEADYDTNVDAMVQQGCDVVFGVGFLLEESLNAAAGANPDTDFALIDEVFSEEHENAKPLVFNTAEAAYLGGYVAAAMTESGTVGTWGGIQIPSVTVFMDGFSDGVDRYNEDNDEDVELVGWDKDAQNGSFSGDFSDQTQGQQVTEQLLAQDADIIMPVAGNAGLGAGPAIESADAQMIWVDSDGYESTEYGDIILTSVLKQISQAVYDTIEEGVNEEFSNEPYVGDLENEGVGLAPFHDFEDDVPEEVVEAVEQITEEIIAGETVVESDNAPSEDDAEAGDEDEAEEDE
ncbi:BMP family lipoprotein [Nesterenkonia populi]|uniref:BMP family lipoprotein n=1 Tax=Nesterenkonia populi TaxID=1591087 RepID=UPI0011BEC62D|nr:BMP family ABC transporter substrate-binding protein [Nesterenkonia populi]